MTLTATPDADLYAALAEAAPPDLRAAVRAFAAAVGVPEKFCQEGGNAGKPGPCPEDTPQAPAGGKLSALLSQAKKLPAAALGRAKAAVQGAYRKAEAKYGSKWAKVIVGAFVAGLPLPGGTLLPAPVIAAAMLHRKLTGGPKPAALEGTGQRATTAYDVAPPLRQHDDARLSRFCQSGANSGKPGPCPEQGSVPAGAGDRRAARAAREAAYQARAAEVRAKIGPKRIAAVQDQIRQMLPAYSHKTVYGVRMKVFHPSVPEKDLVGALVAAGSHPHKVYGLLNAMTFIGALAKSETGAGIRKDGSGPRMEVSYQMPFAHAERFAGADATLYAELSKFCMEGENEGKPGVCPHEMTRAEHGAAKAKRAAELLGNSKSLDKLKKAARQADQELGGSHREAVQKALASGKNVPDEVLKDYPEYRALHTLSQAEYDRLDNARIKSPGGPLAGDKIPGQGLTYGQLSRRNVVRAALATGKHVPPEVLADYPDLAKHAECFSDADLYASLSRFCQSGDNAGKPGPCPAEVAEALKPHLKGTAREALSAPGELGRLTRAVKKQFKGITPRHVGDALGHLARGGALPEADPPPSPRPAERKEAAPASSSHAHVVEAVTRHGGEGNLASLVDVRRHLAEQGIGDRSAQDAAIHSARQRGLVSASALEGREGVSPAEHAAAIPQEDSHPLGFLSLRKHAEKFSEGAGRIHSVEAFASGVHRDKEYSPADVDSMAKNFNRLSAGPRALLKVPAVIGHEEDQDKLDASDLPAAGWTEKAWARWQRCPACGGKAQVMGEGGGRPKPCALCDGHGKRRVLMLDFADVPDEVAPLIDGKAYRKVSAEVYDDPPEGLPGKGKTLRRVAFLGADVPQVKGLADIPRVTKSSEAGGGRQFAPVPRVTLRFCETRASKTPGAFWCFSEVHAEDDMDRDAMIAELQKHGCDADAIKGADDAALAEMLRVCQSKADDGQGDDDQYDEDDENPKDKGDPFAEFDDELPDGKDDAEKQEYAERARKYAARAGTFAARGRKYMEKYCAMKHDDAPARTDTATDMSGSDEIRGKNQDAQKRTMFAKDPENPYDDHDEGTPSPQPKKTTVTHQFNEARVAAIVRREFKAALDGQVGKKLKQFESFTEQQLASQKKATVEAFCEEQLKAGRLLPYQLDRADPANVFDALMRADATRVVTKFREGKKDVALTEFDLAKRAILQAQPRRFAEAVKGAPGKGKASADDGEDVVLAEAHYDAFSESYQAMGKEREGAIREFKALPAKARESLAADYRKQLAG